MSKSKSLFLAITLFLSYFLSAQEPRTSGLFIQLRKADSILFEQGFNKCNMTALEKIVAADLEFLHDQGGMQNREQFFKAVRQNICADSINKPIRKLVDSTLTVYPLTNNGTLYAAIQMGVHEFYRAVPGKPPVKTSTAKFIHTWFLENGEWILKRVLSYDHQN